MSLANRFPVFCALARDVRPALERHEPVFRRWLEAFPESRWIFVENDSKDGTRQWLEAWAAGNPNIRVIGEPQVGDTFPKTTRGGVHPSFSVHRISRMAGFRNLYLERIRTEIGWQRVSSVVVMDVDVWQLPERIVTDRLRTGHCGSVLTALGVDFSDRGVARFFDAYAFEEIDEPPQLTRARVEARCATLLERFTREKGAQEIGSNFNGLAIYPAGLLEGTAYEVLPNDDTEIECLCEHVALHHQIRRKGGVILLDPELRVNYRNRFRAIARGVLKQCRKYLSGASD